MSARGLLAFAASAGVGFLAARALLGRDPSATPPLPDQLQNARSRLLAARDVAVGALVEARSARDEAASDLTQDYLRRTRGRPEA